MTAPLTVLATGGSGQVARALEQAATGASLAVRRVGRPQFDFDRPASIVETLEAARPALVVNAAAYTAVDAAEKDAAAAWRANCDGPAAIAAWCARASVPLIHISTDYVFDGQKTEPYVETDATRPTGVYGASKLAGELAVATHHPHALILRTSWVYAVTGQNFVLTMLRAAQTRDHLRVVADQRGCPTAADALADAVLATAEQILRGWSDDMAGIYHAAGDGETTWHEFALAIFAEAERHGRRSPVIEAITTADWPTAARRPANSRLDCGKLAQKFGVRQPHWRESLVKVLADVFFATSVCTGRVEAV